MSNDSGPRPFRQPVQPLQPSTETVFSEPAPRRPPDPVFEAESRRPSGRESRYPWEGCELLPAELAPDGFPVPPGKITLSRVDDGVELSDATRRSPQDIGLQDIVSLGGSGRYVVNLWDARHTRIILKHNLLVAQGERKPWPPPLPNERRPSPYSALVPQQPSPTSVAKPGAVVVGGVEIDLSGLTGSGGAVGLLAALAPSIMGYLSAKTAAEEAKAAAERARLEAMQERIARQAEDMQKGHVDLLRDVLAQQVDSSNNQAKAMADLLMQAKRVDEGGSSGASQQMLSLIERLNTRIDQLSTQRTTNLAEVEQALHLLEQVRQKVPTASAGGGAAEGGAGGFDMGMVMQNLDKIAQALKIMLGPTPTGPAAPAGLPVPVTPGTPFGTQ